MKKLALTFIAFALVLAACSSDNGSQVVSLDDGANADDVATVEVDADVANGEAILEFSQCMRDNGIEDFQDPNVAADGSIEFSFSGSGSGSEADRDVMREAFESCQEHLEGLAFGPGSFDLTEIEDTMLEFSVCMRENGVDIPDPDFSSLGFGGGDGGQGDGDIFGGALDIDDPKVAAAIEVCQEVFGDSFRVGGGNG
jgi:hypothetical protein